MTERRNSAVAVLAVAACVAMIGADIQAQTQAGGVVLRNTTTSTTPTQAGAVANTGLSSSDLEVARMWGLSSDEMRRAKLLLAGPRGTFSQPNLSPVEALGIHARNPAEQQKYATAFARALHDDTERVVAWMRAYEGARQSLYGTETVIDFSKLREKPVVDPGIAAAARVPRSAYTPAPQKVAPVRK